MAFERVPPISPHFLIPQTDPWSQKNRRREVEPREASRFHQEKAKPKLPMGVSDPAEKEPGMRRPAEQLEP